MTVFYVAVLVRNAAGQIFAHIPDLPGVTSLGAARGQALHYVVEFANERVRYLAESGIEIPAARDIDAIPIEAPEFARALVPVEVPGKSVKISVSIDEALLKRVDRAAAAASTTRSGYFAAAAASVLRANAPDMAAHGTPTLLAPPGNAKT